jgi:hypothetical protein
MNTQSSFFIIRRKVIFDCLDRFPDSGSLTLAKKIYKEHPELFTSVENVRNIIRFYRGSHGKKSLSTLKDKKYVRQPVSIT